MSTATAAEAPPPAKGKKKLIIMVAIALLVLAIGGGAAAFLLKKPVDAELAEDDVAEGADAEQAAGPAKAAKAVGRHDPKNPPVFVPLDPFTVNLADREAERYAQIGITLEIDGAETGEQIKLYMPAIRNNILMAIADRTAGELMDRSGKARLADKVKRETARALGFAVAEDDDEAPAAADDDTAGTKGKAKPRKKKKAEPALPVRAVHFSNFIIQ